MPVAAKKTVDNKEVPVKLSFFDVFRVTQKHPDRRYEWRRKKYDPANPDADRSRELRIIDPVPRPTEPAKDDPPPKYTVRDYGKKLPEPTVVNKPDLGTKRTIPITVNKSGRPALTEANVRANSVKYPEIPRSFNPTCYDYADGNTAIDPCIHHLKPPRLAPMPKPTRTPAPQRDAAPVVKAGNVPLPPYALAARVPDLRPIATPAQAITKPAFEPDPSFSATDDLKLLELASRGRSWGELMRATNKGLDQVKKRYKEIYAPVNGGSGEPTSSRGDLGNGNGFGNGMGHNATATGNQNGNGNGNGFGNGNGHGNGFGNGVGHGMTANGNRNLNGNGSGNWNGNRNGNTNGRQEGNGNGNGTPWKRFTDPAKEGANGSGNGSPSNPFQVPAKEEAATFPMPAAWPSSPNPPNTNFNSPKQSSPKQFSPKQLSSKRRSPPKPTAEPADPLMPETWSNNPSPYDDEPRQTSPKQRSPPKRTAEPEDPLMPETWPNNPSPYDDEPTPFPAAAAASSPAPASYQTPAAQPKKTLRRRKSMLKKPQVQIGTATHR